MTPSSDPALLTIVQARREMRAGRLSAVELTEAALAAVQRLNPRLNAYLARLEARPAFQKAAGMQ